MVKRSETIGSPRFFYGLGLVSEACERGERGKSL